MTDQDKAQLTPSEQHLAEELTRIANRQMQVVDRLDKIQERLAEGVVTADDLKMRVERIEGIQKQPTELMQRILMPLMIVNLSLTTGNIALTLGVAIALVNHMLAH